MQVTIITTWATDLSSGSGTAVFYHSLIKGLKSRGCDIELIAPNFDVSDYVNVTLQRLLFNSQIVTDPRIHQADVVIGFDYDGYGLSTLHRPPLIASSHTLYGDILQWETGEIATMVKAQAFFDRVMMENSDIITIGSQYAKDRIIELYNIPAEKILVIPHGAVEQKWMSLVDTAPRVINNHPIILAVGKMFPRKRIDILLQAIPSLLCTHPTLEVRIAGDGLMLEAYQQLAAELDICEHVTFLGNISDEVAFAREWRQADIFCHPSSQETFGYVYLEAMQLGKPIVAVRAGSAPEVLGNAARLAEPENPESLAEALQFFLSNPSACEDYSEKAKLRAEKYTHDAMIDGYVRAIQFAQRYHNQ